jgi:hypothetical protein
MGTGLLTVKQSQEIPGSKCQWERRWRCLAHHTSNTYCGTPLGRPLFCLVPNSAAHFHFHILSLEKRFKIFKCLFSCGYVVLEEHLWRREVVLGASSQASVAAWQEWPGLKVNGLT